MRTRDIVVVGGSAGSLEGVLAITTALGKETGLSILVVIHSNQGSPGILPHLLSRNGSMPAHFAGEREPLRHGHIYVAPPDRHLLIKGNNVLTTHGPKENRFRPAVDPLFRTAARAHGPRVIGVILSGMMDDGVHGLSLVKHHGGVAIVQDPAEALADGMPMSAIRDVEVDFVLGVAQIGPLLLKLSETPLPPSSRRKPSAMKNEPDIAEVGSRSITIRGKQKAGDVTPFTCPECGGALWASQDGRMTLYRCHVGHGYTETTLIAGQQDVVELHLWESIRALEEHAEIHRLMADRRGISKQRAGALKRDAQEMVRRALILRRIVAEQRDKPPVKGAPAKSPGGRRAGAPGKEAGKGPAARGGE